MKKQSIYFLVIIILLVQTSCQQNNEEEDFFNNQITLLENNPRLYLSKIDSTQVTNLNNSKEATHFLLVSLANHYINNYYPHKGLLQKSIHIFTKKKLIQQQLESLLFLAKTYKKEKNLKMEVQAIEKAIDIASQIEDKEWLCCLYGYLGDMLLQILDKLLRCAGKSQSLRLTAEGDQFLDQLLLGGLLTEFNKYGCGMSI